MFRAAAANRFSSSACGTRLPRNPGPARGTLLVPRAAYSAVQSGMRVRAPSSFSRVSRRTTVPLRFASDQRQELLQKYGPPITVEGPAGAAATALYVRAGMDNAHSQVETSVQKLLEEIRNNDSLRTLLRNSASHSAALTVQQVQKLATELQRELGLDAVTTEFLEYARRNNVLHDLDTALENYLKMLWRAKKEVHGTLTCVTEQEAQQFAQSKEFATLTAEHVPQDHRLVLRYAADPSILQGFRLTLEDRVLELTLASLISRFDAAVAGQAELSAKRVQAAVDGLPVWVSSDTAAAEARQYLNHPLANLVRLRETYVGTAKA